MDHHHPEAFDHACDWREVADKIKIEIIKSRTPGIVGGDIGQSIAVGKRSDYGFCCEIAAHAWPILNNELLTKTLRQPLTDQSREKVVGAASGKADNDSHRPRRIRLRPSDTRHGRERGSASGEMQKMSAGKFHFEPPFTSFNHLV